MEFGYPASLMRTVMLGECGIDMASVLIRNLELPKECDECWAYDDNHDYPHCNITHSSMGFKWKPYGQRMPNCPLSEVVEKFKENSPGCAVCRELRFKDDDCLYFQHRYEAGTLFEKLHIHYCPICGRDLMANQVTLYYNKEGSDKNENPESEKASVRELERSGSD